MNRVPSMHDTITLVAVVVVKAQEPDRSHRAVVAMYLVILYI